MAYYKVPQDVEAEDKLVFGFTFKQFIFAIIFFVSGFVGFQLVQISFVLLGPILPVFLGAGLLAFYRPKDQPAETKIIAYVNFWFQPRRRLWSRDGLLERVHIQMPKSIDRTGIVKTRDEVRSQLKTLASIVDTRGWATKQATLQEPTIGGAMISHDDRLITPQQVQVMNQPLDDQAVDIMDESVNPVAQAFGQLAEQAEVKERQQAIEKMKAAMAEPAPSQTATQPPTKISNVHSFGVSADGSQLPNDQDSTPLTPHFNPYPQGIHQKNLVKAQAEQEAEEEKATPPSKDVIELASEDELPVDVIAHEAQRRSQQADEVEFDIQH